MNSFFTTFKRLILNSFKQWGEKSKKLMKIFVLSLSLLFVFSAVSIVSAHPGHGTEPVVEDLNPKDSSQSSGNVKISPKIHQTRDMSHVDFNITGPNSYKKIIRTLIHRMDGHIHGTQVM